MRIVVCLDDAGGMLFNHRRQSRDRFVIDDILKLTELKTLYISEFSTKLFADSEKAYKISENMLDEAESEDYCFVENISLAPYASKIDQIVVYRWNRLYPSDMRFDIDLAAEGFSKATSEEFKGYSHEKITKEIYVR